MVILGSVLVSAVVYIIVSDYLFLKKDKTKMVRSKLYKEMIIKQWTMLLLVCLAWQIGGFKWRDLVSMKGTSSIEFSGSFMAGFLTSVIVVILVMTLLMNKKNKQSVPVVGDIDFMLPRTKRERIGFTFIALTAGICEEMIFRGAMGMFLVSLPSNLTLTTVAIISAVIFGMAHYYQGWKGMLATGLFGYVMFNLYISTGSLLLPMLVHFIVDVKFVFMPNKELLKDEQLAT